MTTIVGGNDSFQIRTLHLPEDFRPLLRLMEEIEAADQAGEVATEASLSAEFDWFGHDPQKDRWIVESADFPGRFLGHAWTFAQTRRRSVIFLAVHPAVRRRGVASALLNHALSRAREKGADQAVAIAFSNNAQAAAFLETNGFTAMGQNRFMTAAADIVVPQPVWPEGFYASSYAEFDDLSLYVEALNACYADMWGHAQNTQLTQVESFAKSVERYKDHYDPRGMYVVFDDNDEVSGVCLGIVETGVEPDETVNVLDSPAVVPQYRSLPLLRPLTLTVMRWLKLQSSAPFRLDSWGDSEEAEGVYRDLGFDFTANGKETEYLLELV